MAVVRHPRGPAPDNPTAELPNIATMPQPNNSIERKNTWLACNKKSLYGHFITVLVRAEGYHINQYKLYFA